MLSVRIFDPMSDKTRLVKNIHKIDHTMPNKEGEMNCIPCVEFTVIGKNREWPLWCTLEMFKIANPNVAIEGE